MLELHGEHGGRIVSKLLGHAFIRTFGDEMVRYTERVSHRDLANVNAIRHCPMIFQAYVEKRIELRITVVGRRVLAAEIHSQTSHHTRHDWRRFDDHATPHFVHALPAAVERRCLALTERLGLRYVAGGAPRPRADRLELGLSGARVARRARRSRCRRPRS